jgi:predicted CoA-binding protein
MTELAVPDSVEREISGILLRTRNVAVVGLSGNPERESHKVAAYLQSHGFRIIPVNPELDTVLGEVAYPDLDAIPRDIWIDVVDVFRRVELVPDVVAQALARGVGSIWLQLGLRHDASAVLAKNARVPFVQDRCIKVEHAARQHA